MADYNLFYYPWITQHVDAFEIRQAINTFASAVEALVGKTIEVRQPVDVPAQIARVCERDGTIGLMNPLGFLLAKRRMPQVEAINVALRPEIIVAKDGTYKLGKLVPRYRAQLYTNDRSAIVAPEKGAPWFKQFRRAAGASLAFGTTFSTSNFLVPARMMAKDWGVNPLTGFTRLQFLGGHDSVAKAVYAGNVDVGAGHDGVIADLARQPGFGDAKARLVRLGWTNEIPSDPIVANIADPKARGALADAMVKACNDATASAALSRFWGGVTKLAKQTSKEYALLGDAMDALGLSDHDVLGA